MPGCLGAAGHAPHGPGRGGPRRPRPRRRRRRRPGTPWRSTGSPSACASGSSTRCTACTCRRCRRAPSSTRACSPGTSWRSSSPTSPTRPSTAGWPSCTRGSRPTPSRRGRWPIPYRYLAHNGEINTLRGNRNWMRAREALLASDLIPGDLERLFPICDPDGSDSASFDEVLELLHLGGRSLPHAVLMMIPEAWENHTAMDPARRAFYRYHASLMEPWDGPAGVVFTDGTVAGGVLDRNGLRPARYWVTDDGLVVLASEVGVLDIDPARVVRKGRLQPGRMFLVDTAQGRIVDDDEIKAQLAAAHPYGQWLEEGQVTLGDLPPRMMLTPQHASVVTHQELFGYTNEELRLILGSHGQDRGRGARVDGPRRRHRRAVGAAAPHLRLLHPAVRAGDQPAARRHPRGARHLEPLQARARGQPARADRGVVPADHPALPGHRQRRAGQAGLRQRARRDAGLPGLRHRRTVRPGRRRRGAARRHRGRAQAGEHRHRPRLERHHPLRPQLQRAPGAHPVAAAHRGGARAPGPGEVAHRAWAWWWSPATPARCTTSPCSSGTAPRR